MGSRVVANRLSTVSGMQERPIHISDSPFDDLLWHT